MRRLRRILVLLSVTLALAGGAVGYARLSRSADAGSSRFVTARVDRGRIVGKVTATGTLSAIVTVQVGSQVSGRIHKLLVDFNSPVKKGQVIAKIDPALFRAAVDQARANLLAAEGNLEKARAQAADASRQYERAQELASRKLVAPADRDTAQANSQAAAATVSAAKGAVGQARAALGQARINLAYTTIVSPTDGVVISRNVDVGQTVAASLQAPTLFVIAEDLRKMQVDTSVAEADIGRLRPGMPAVFTVDAYPGERFQGAVKQIRNAPQTVQNVVTYDAVIDVANPELKLKPGMTANVTFIYADRADALRVPTAALRFRPSPADLEGSDEQGSSPPGTPPLRGGAPGGADPAHARSVWVLDGGRPRRALLTVGVTDGSHAEVVGGPLAEGDAVIVESAAPGRRRSGGGPPPMRKMF